MRLGSLVALACLVGCKTQAAGSAAPVETSHASNEDAGQAPAAEAPERGSTQSTQDAADDDPERGFCEKLTALMIAERGSDPESSDTEELVETCVANARRKRAGTPATFEREAECISDAANLTAFFDCALDPPAPRTSGTSRFLPLCKKLAELARNEPDFPEEVMLELQNTDRCEADAQTEHAAGPHEFERIEDCILAATGMQEAAACTGGGALAQ